MSLLEDAALAKVGSKVVDEYASFYLLCGDGAALEADRFQQLRG
jgi:hypothetical protein